MLRESYIGCIVSIFWLQSVFSQLSPLPLPSSEENREIPFPETCMISAELAQASSPSSENDIVPSAASPYITSEGTEEPLLEGIVLVRAGVNIHDVKRRYGVEIELGEGDFAELKNRLQEYLNHPLDKPTLNTIKKTIVTYFREEKNTYTAVMIPVQEVGSGIVLLQLLEGVLGEIAFEGQYWFSPWVLQRALGIKKGDPLDETALFNGLMWANRSPYHRTQMILSPGKLPGTTDVRFLTRDRLPLRLFTGADNTGYQSNGQIRLYAGGSWGNAFMLGDILSYQYTASPDFHHFQAHVANYSAFLPWKHLLTLFGCYAQVYPIIPDYDSSGINVQGSLRYQVPFKPLFGNTRSYIEGGLDYKYLTSNLFFLGNIFQEPDTNGTNNTITVNQILLSYRYQRNWPQYLLTFKIDQYASLWEGLFPFQNPSAYEGMRLGSHVRYAYWKVSVAQQYKLSSGFSASWLTRGQLATGTLPPSEQFGLGGFDTVRGYFEQQFLADDAFCTNLEVYTPPFSLLRLKQKQEQMAFLAFLDYGFGYNYTASAPQYIEQNLLGIGAGLRYDIVPNLNLKADWGFQVIGIPQDHRLGRLHLSGTLSY